MLFGRLVRAGGWQRDDLFISNKSWLEFYPQQSIAGRFEGSLGRLQMDYLDLAYCEKPPAALPLLELIRAGGRPDQVRQPALLGRLELVCGADRASV